MGISSTPTTSRGNRAAVGGSSARTLLPDPVPGASYDGAQATCTYDDAAPCTVQRHHDLAPGTVLNYGSRHVVLEGR